MLNRNFLDIYKKVLQPGGIVRLKTDNHDLFVWAKELLSEQQDIEVMRSLDDLHKDSADEDLLIETTFTQKYIVVGTPISYLEFHFR